MNLYRKAILFAALVSMSTAISSGQSINTGRHASEEIRRVNAAAQVLEEVMATPDKGIPEDLLAAARCVAIVPSMMKGGFLVGAKFGKGVATCRTSKGWSGPAPFTIAGGSWGLQFGGEAVDLLMLVMNEKGVKALQANNLRLGTEGSVAAGPVGRQAEADTDWKTRSEVLTYSRARGVFTGIELNGAVIKQDDEETRTLYGKMLTFRRILAGKIAAPEGSERFLSAVQKYSQPRGATSNGASADASRPTGIQ